VRAMPTLCSHARAVVVCERCVCDARGLRCGGGCSHLRAFGQLTRMVDHLRQHQLLIAWQRLCVRHIPPCITLSPVWSSSCICPARSCTRWWRSSMPYGQVRGWRGAHGWRRRSTRTRPVAAERAPPRPTPFPPSRVPKLLEVRSYWKMACGGGTSHHDTCIRATAADVSVLRVLHWRTSGLLQRLFPSACRPSPTAP
jgi:hypothetical protein